jgi:SAM-dependent methyltransferase
VISDEDEGSASDTIGGGQTIVLARWPDVTAPEYEMFALSQSKGVRELWSFAPNDMESNLGSLRCATSTIASTPSTNELGSSDFCVAGLEQNAASCDLETTHLGRHIPSYIRYMVTSTAQDMAKWSTAGAEIHTVRVLDIGLGLGTSVAFLTKLAPVTVALQVESIELRADIIDACMQHFACSGKHPRAVIETHQSDCLQAVLDRAEKGKLYDYIFVDCFHSDASVPGSCCSPLFVKTAASLLRPGGSIKQNIWNHHIYNIEIRNDFETTLASYRQIFDNVSMWGSEQYDTTAYGHNVAITGYKSCEFLISIKCTCFDFHVYNIVQRHRLDRVNLSLQ